MDLNKALSLSLGEISEPVITRYRLGLIVHRLYSIKSYQGDPLASLKRDHAGTAEFHRALSSLEASGILKDHPNFRKRVYRLLGRKEESIEEVACTIDPFCYVSHLSAMSHHGLTNRLPVKLFLSSPGSQLWKEEAHKQMRKDLGDELEIYLSEALPLLSRVNMLRIGQTEIHRFSSIHWGAYKNIRGKAIRVSTIGRTFLDMLRKPELCGGMRHVIEVFDKHASTYLPAIVGEINQHGGPIDKVRAGYILDERMKLEHPTIDHWVDFASRGGSRKLDASEEYLPNWSEKWSISLNMD
jgi:predicted transcriptional regulator of viral defense system